MNQIIIEGNLGSDPELKQYQNTNFATFSLAHTPYVEGVAQEEKTIWFQVTFWGAKSDLVLENLKKGSRIQVVGKLTQNTYTNKAGETKTSLNINGSSFSLTPKNPYRKAVDSFTDDFAKDAAQW
jgi:single-strand DNA-binding protein